LPDPVRIIAQHYKTGDISLLEVPAPACRPGGVLVRTEFSLISTGTEMMKVAESKLSMLGKARARPDHVRTVLQSVAQQGALATYRKVMSRLDSYTPLGYSSVGVIEQVGDGVEGLVSGQRVACGGNQYALHAEFNWVPVNLCVPVPERVSPEHAAFTTVGAIAMQGFRQSEARLGETACIIGLGLVGQLLLQILRAAGVGVVGIDVDETRCELAMRLGAAATGAPDSQAFHALTNRVAEMTRGAGCDHVFLAAGSDSNQPVELAARLARDRGRIVDIGKSRLDLPWKDYYEKELDVRFSRSYGPGRYDATYEEQGVDYPIGYVRWTERRNMECFVDLLHTGRLDLGPLTTHVVPFESAVSVYERINAGELRGLGILFRYEPAASSAQCVPERDANGAERAAGALAGPPAVARSVVPRVASAPLRVAAIGCGNYGSSVILPHLSGREDIELVEVVTQTGLSAANAARKHGFARMSTDAGRVLADDRIDIVLILTRHGSHAGLVCDALRAGKAVFVEKPLAIDEAQLGRVAEAIADSGNDRLMVGFNRRFAPALVRLKTLWGKRVGPHVVQYRVNAGTLDPKSWYAHAATEGSRFVGEGGHFIDTVSWWLDADPTEVTAVCTPDDPDNLVVTLRYPDGSTGVVTYATKGDRRYPKELFEVFGQGMAAKLDNFARSELWRGGKPTVHRALGGVDKGQRAELAAFLEAVRTAGPMPIALPSLMVTTRATIAAARGSTGPQVQRDVASAHDPPPLVERAKTLKPEPVS
jgi:predicted dehydrogenase/threonine dehydrogenase-like Zn-dependent dehydrogenase